MVITAPAPTGLTSIGPVIGTGTITGPRETLSYLHVQQDNVPDGGVSTFGLKGYAYVSAYSAA